MSATKYPDHDLIKKLTDIYIGKSISAMTTAQITDLINHLRQYVKDLQDSKNELRSALEEASSEYYEHLKSEDGELANIYSGIVLAKQVLEKNKF